MKKILSILISLFICVASISCVQIARDDVNGDYSQETEKHTEMVGATQTESGDNTLDNSGNGTNTPNIDEPIVYEPSTRLESYGDYCEYIEIHDQALPDDFITYEKLSSIGEFDLLIFSVSGDHTFYQYILNGEGGFKIVVSIEHYTEEEKKVLNASTTNQPIQLQNLPSSNMIYTSVYKSQAVIYNGIQYSYNSDGELRALMIWIDNIRIYFYPDDVFVCDDSGKVIDFVRLSFADYKPTSENIIMCLFSGNQENMDIAASLTDASK